MREIASTEAVSASRMMFWRNLKAALAKEGEALAMEAMFTKRAEELFESLLEQSEHAIPFVPPLTLPPLEEGHARCFSRHDFTRSRISRRTRQLGRNAVRRNTAQLNRRGWLWY